MWVVAGGARDIADSDGWLLQHGSSINFLQDYWELKSERE
jgi:hypothetical protein